LLSHISWTFQTAAYAVRDYASWIKFFLNLAMRGLRTKYHVTKKAREFLFEGYNDPLLDLAAHLPPGITPVAIPFDKFGWFYTVSLFFSYINRNNYF
jgi:hypothetical protein